MLYAMNGDVSIRYEVEGSGPPLMLHTGYVGVVEDLYTLGYVDALRDHYRLILPDPRGQGHSDKPHNAAAYGPESRIGDVIAVLDALNIDRVHFWGYSMGGRIGFDLAVQRPERLQSLVLGGAHPFGSSPDQSPWLDELRQGHVAEVLAGEFFRELPSEIRDRWVAMSDPEALVAATVEEPTLEAQLSGVQVPALIYSGDRDDSHERARRAAEALPEATFLSLPGLSHLGAILRSHVVLPHVLAFLRGLHKDSAARVREDVAGTWP